MPAPVTATAMAMCSFGVAPSTLAFLPATKVLVEGKPVGTIPDNVTGLNIPPFGMCTSLANPAVATATAAALGVLTPMPCTPLAAGPWLPTAPKTLVAGKPVLAQNSQCVCSYAGVITISFPGAVRTQVN